MQLVLCRSKDVMKPSVKSKIPLAFLTIISIWWWYFYSSSNALNDYGNAKHEWLFMLDALLVLPILCFLCESDKQKALECGADDFDTKPVDFKRLLGKIESLIG